MMAGTLPNNENGHVPSHLKDLICGIIEDPSAKVEATHNGNGNGNDERSNNLRIVAGEEHGNLFMATIDADNNDFGRTLAVSADGNCVVVGSKSAVYIYNRKSVVCLTKQQQQDYVYANSNNVNANANAFPFYFSIAMNAIGNQIVVGNANKNEATVFDEQGNILLQWQMNNDVSYQYGKQVAMSPDGSVIVVAAPKKPISEKNDGAVFIYDKNGQLLHELHNPNPHPGEDYLAANQFGISLAIQDNRHVIIGAEWESFVFDVATGELVFVLEDPTGSDDVTSTFGQHVAITQDFMVVTCLGFDGIEAVHLFDRITGNPVQSLDPQEWDIPHVQYFKNYGWDISMSTNRLLVSETWHGQVFVYHKAEPNNSQASHVWNPYNQTWIAQDPYIIQIPDIDTTSDTIQEHLISLAMSANGKYGFIGVSELNKVYKICFPNDDEKNDNTIKSHQSQAKYYDFNINVPVSNSYSTAINFSRRNLATTDNDLQVKSCNSNQKVFSSSSATALMMGATTFILIVIGVALRRARKS